MNKHISLLSLSLLLVPATYYAMDLKPTPLDKTQDVDSSAQGTTPETIENLTDSRILRSGSGSEQSSGSTNPFNQPTSAPLNNASLNMPIVQPTQQTTMATSMPTFQPILKNSRTDSPLTRSTVEERKKALQASPAHEVKPWRIAGLVNAFRDATAIALSEIYYLNGKPENLTEVAHKLEWGINDTLAKIHTIRDANKPVLTKLPEHKKSLTPEESKQIKNIIEENRRKLADSLLTILRQEREHNANLNTIILGAFNNDVNLNEGVLENAHTHLEKARQEALQYQKYALQESKQYLQQDKQLRRDIYDIKLIKRNLDVPSDDEYNDESICQHYLNVAAANETDLGFLDFK